MPVVDTGSPASEPACSQWVTVDDLCCAVSGIASDEQIDLAISTASQVLWALSGRRFGTCPISIRPCRRRCQVEPWPTLSPSWDDYAVSPWSSWYARCGACAYSTEDCGCQTLEQIELPRPVASVTQVTVDGVVLPTSAYRVDNRRYLVRLDGLTWPTCQDMSLDLSQPGTFGVEELRGRAIPSAGVSAAGELSCELVKSCLPGVTCQLPKRVTTITRAGTSMTMLDPMDFLERGLTGLYRVDLFLTAYNRSRLRRRGSVASPDSLRRRGRVVGT